MRDLFLLAVLLVLVPMIFRRPYLGALAWAWVSLMSPHRLAYGFATTLPYAMVVAVATLAALPMTKQKYPLPKNAITVLLIVFVCWMSFTTLFALNPDSEGVMYAWRQSLKTHLMLLVTLVLIRGRDQIEKLVWVMVVSIGFFGTKGGYFTIATGGEFRVWGPSGTFIEGNNELALALVALVPLMYYLIVVSKNAWVRKALWLSMVLCVFSILGSHSRGALLAILAMALFFIAKSNRPFLLGIGVSAVLAVAVLSMPAEWTQRMETIQDYQSDGSAQSRINTWHTIWNMAIDRPIVGAGYRVGSDLLYQRYSPKAVAKSFDSHSIYFQALGEHGFVGLALYLMLGMVTWRKARKLARDCAQGPESEWVPLLMRMIQVSMIGFAADGAFLGLLHYDFPYYLAGLVVLVGATVEADRRAAAANSAALVPGSPLGGPADGVRRLMTGRAHGQSATR